MCGAQKQALGVDAVFLFSCDPKPASHKFTRATANWQHHFEDIRALRIGCGSCAIHATVCELPSGQVDIFICGFPCQPFSATGRKEGFDDAKGRRQIFFTSSSTSERSFQECLFLKTSKRGGTQSHAAKVVEFRLALSSRPDW